MTNPEDGADTLTCLRGGTIFAFDAEKNVFEDGELWLKGPDILSVGTRGAFTPPNDRITYVDIPGRMILPGFINAHTHSYSALLKGSVESEPLDIYMLAVIATGAAMTPREIYVSAQLDALAMLHTGVTSAIDHYSERPALSADGLNAVCTAFEDIGMRATVATMFADLPYIDTVPVDRRKLPAEILAAAASHPTPDAKAYFGIKTQAAMRREGGPGFVRRMADLGILDENSSLVHFIWSSDDDIAAAAETGLTVVHSPVSNAMLGAGLAPILRLRKAGIPVAYGTDGSNCGPPGLLESMRMGCYMMRLTDPDFEQWPDARTILSEGYSAGARALGRAGKIGTLEAGTRADITVLKPVDHWHRPMGNPYRHLLYYENGSSTEHVWVDGRQVVKDGRVTTIDEEALIAEAEEIAARRRGNMSAGALDAVAAQYPAFRQMILDNFAADIGIDRRINLS
mgnify:CR=1 FL=1